MEVLLAFLVGAVVGAVGILVVAGVAARRQEAQIARMVRDFEESGIALGRKRPDGTVERVDPKSIDPRGPK